MRYYLGLHTNLVHIVTVATPSGDEDIIELQIVRPAHVMVKDEVMLNAATHLMLASYRNQLLHVYIRPAMIALTVNSCQADTMPISKCL